jgi:squalene cyclase
MTTVCKPQPLGAATSMQQATSDTSVCAVGSQAHNCTCAFRWCCWNLDFKKNMPLHMHRTAADTTIHYVAVEMTYYYYTRKHTLLHAVTYSTNAVESALQVLCLIAILTPVQFTYGSLCSATTYYYCTSNTCNYLLLLHGAQATLHEKLY